MSYSTARVENLARKLGVSFREAASMVGRKGNRVRREREARRQQLRVDARPVHRWWQEGQYE